MMRQCRTCKESKPAEEMMRTRPMCKECKRKSAAKYYALKGDDVRRRAREYHHKNKERRHEAHKAWCDANPGAHRRNYYKRAYGITLEQRHAQEKSQGGKCLLCETRFETIPQRHVHVDHDHDTGNPRGLLCHWCNTQMGTLEKSPEWIARALAYIARGGDWVASEPDATSLKAVA